MKVGKFILIAGFSALVAAALVIAINGFEHYTRKKNIEASARWARENNAAFTNCLETQASDVALEILAYDVVRPWKESKDDYDCRAPDCWVSSSDTKYRRESETLSGNHAKAVEVLTTIFESCPSVVMPLDLEYRTVEYWWKTLRYDFPETSRYEKAHARLKQQHEQIEQRRVAVEQKERAMQEQELNQSREWIRRAP